MNQDHLIKQMAHKEATVVNDNNSKQIMRQNTNSQSQQQIEEDELRLVNKKAIIKANQDVNSILHQRKLEMIKKEKDRERQIANIQNKKKLEIERQLREQEDKLMQLKSIKQKTDIVNQLE